MKMRSFLIVGLLASLLLAGGVSYYRSTHPDGLEKAAQDVGFLNDKTASVTADSPLAGYGVSGVKNDRLSVGLAGVLGVLVIAAVAGGGFILLARKSKQQS